MQEVSGVSDCQLCPLQWLSSLCTSTSDEKPPACMKQARYKTLLMPQFAPNPLHLLRSGAKVLQYGLVSQLLITYCKKVWPSFLFTLHKIRQPGSKSKHYFMHTGLTSLIPKPTLSHAHAHPVASLKNRVWTPY